MDKKRITLKKVIKQLSNSKIKGIPSKYIYYCYDNHEYHKIDNFDLMEDRFRCVDGCWQYFNCKDKNIRLYYEKEAISKEIKLATGESV